MKSYFILLIALSWVCSSIVALHAQDERYFRDLLAGDLTRELPPVLEAPRFRAFAPLYEMDLTGNHRFERLVLEMRDAQDWLSILDYQKSAIFRYHLGPTAAGSRVYRLRKLEVNAQVQALVIYYYEGVNTYLGINANARAHIITYNPNDIQRTIRGFKGPVFWEEFQNGREHYRRRSYDLEFVDLNNNGTKEMVLKFENITRIYQFQESGEWKLI